MEDNSEEIMEKILQADSDTYVIFYKEGCPFCDKARQKLRESDVKFKAYDINGDIRGKIHLLKVLNEHKDKTNFDSSHTTVPIVFYNKIFIGGSDKLIPLLIK